VDFTEFMIPPLPSVIQVVVFYPIAPSFLRQHKRSCCTILLRRGSVATSFFLFRLS